MRQLILATSLITSGTVAAGTDKGVGFAYDNAGVPTFANAANLLKDYFNIIFKKDATAGENVVHPAYKKNFTYSKAQFAAMSAAASVVADITNTVLTPAREVTVLVAKKGVQFNERNRWSYVHRVTDNDNATTVGDAIAAYFNANPECGVSVANAAGVLTFTGKKLDSAAVIKFTDDFNAVEDASGNVVTSVELNPTRVASGVNKIPSVKEYLEDLLSKAAADAGFRDTRQDNKLYPALTGTSGIDATPYASGFFVYTLRFQEPRIVKQALNEDVTQIIQIVLPSSVTVTTLDSILAALGSQID